MESRSQEQKQPRESGRKPGADALRWVIAHPVAAFVVVTLGSLVLAAVLYLASLFWPLAGKTERALGLYSNASALVQAIVGTALVGASAFVAILIATSAAKTAESALSESRLNNKLNDPDYLSAKQALRGYQQYAFQIGSLLAAWRLHRQQTQLRVYANQKEVITTEAAAPADAGDTKKPGATKKAVASTKTVAAKKAAASTKTPAAKQADIADKGDVTSSGIGVGAPLWENTLEQLQELLSDVSFVSAIYEAARLCDSESGEGARGEDHVQALRKSVAGLKCVIEGILRHKDVAASSETMMNLMARSALLVHQLDLGRAVMERYARDQAEDLGDDPRLKGYPLLRWLVAWTSQIPVFETDRNFHSLLRIPFSEVLMFGGSTIEDALPNAIGDVLVREMPDDSDGRNYGLHRGLLVVTSVGDQSTVLTIEGLAAQIASLQGREPCVVHVTDPNRVPRLGQYSGGARFPIFCCTRKTLPFLFRDGVLGPATEGCVIIDGVRGDGLFDIEDKLAAAQRSTEGSTGQADFKPAPSVAAFVPILAIKEGLGNLRGREFAAPHSADATPADGPRLLWIGVDYRELGVESPARLKDWSCELWSVLQRDGAAIGVDAAQMLSLG